MIVEKSFHPSKWTLEREQKTAHLLFNEKICIFTSQHPTSPFCRLQTILDTYKCYIIMNIEHVNRSEERCERYFHIICIVSHNSHYTNSDYMFTSHLLMKQQSFRWPDEFHNRLYIWDVRCAVSTQQRNIVGFCIVCIWQSKHALTHTNILRQPQLKWGSWNQNEK